MKQLIKFSALLSIIIIIDTRILLIIDSYKHKIILCYIIRIINNLLIYKQNISGFYTLAGQLVFQINPVTLRGLPEWVSEVDILHWLK